jgi:hypothetical protein
MRWPGVVAFRFDSDGGLDAFPERPIDPSWIVDLCRRTVEPLALQSLGWETVHASAVCTASGVMAFCGERQAGKSTVAYALSRRGYQQYADDMVVLQVGSGEIRTLDRPFGVRLRSEPAAFFGFEPDGRHFQDVTPLTSDHENVSTRPIAALFVLRRIQAGDPEIERLEPGAALAAVTPHAYCFNPDGQGRKRLLRNYLHVATTVPVYELRFKAGLERLDSVLTHLEATIDQMQGQPA